MSKPFSFLKNQLSINIDDYRNFYKVVSMGYERVANYKIAICGLVRNIATDFTYLKLNLERLGKLFAASDIFLVENNCSTDNSRQLLQDWATSSVLKIELLGDNVCSENWGSTSEVGRSEYLGKLRNLYLDRIYTQLEKYDYIIVLDTDLSGWCNDHIIHSFGLNNWDVMTANGIDDVHGTWHYYDLWAKLVDNKTNWKVPQMYQPYSKPVKVTSAFGGLAIYNSKCLQSRPQYYAYKNADDKYCSEHVGLHVSIANLGHELFINPSMLLTR